MADIKLLKKLRFETAASVADCRRALEESSGDYGKALGWLKKHGIKKAAKKEGRETGQGIISSYIHGGGRVGVLLELGCETDFVPKTADFQNFAKELSMQVAAMNAGDIESLLKQEYIRDPKQTVSDVIKVVIATLGENIVVKRFIRFEIGS
jgi:elongation factor Ts